MSGSSPRLGHKEIKIAPMITRILQLISMILFIFLSGFILGIYTYKLDHAHIDTGAHQITVLKQNKEIRDLQEEVVKLEGLKTIYASWYNYKLPGDDLYSTTHATAASQVFPRGTMLKICTMTTERCVIVTVNDFGPETWTGRQIDLSSFAFKQLAPLSRGVIVVRVEEL